MAPLVRARFRVVTFDAPGHGQSGAGRSSLIHFADALEALARTVGPLHGAITHSMGGAAATLALSRGLDVTRLVFISPPAWPSRFTDVLASRLGIPERVMDLMRARAERRLGFAWHELSVPPIARSRREPLLVIHDEDDRDVPVEDGVAIAEAWPGAALVRTSGLGHRNVLKNAAGDRARRLLHRGRVCRRPRSRGRGSGSSRMAMPWRRRSRRWRAPRQPIRSFAGAVVAKTIRLRSSAVCSIASSGP